MQQPLQLQWVWGLLLLKSCAGSWTAQSLSSHLFVKLELHSPRSLFSGTAKGNAFLSIVVWEGENSCSDGMRGRGPACVMSWSLVKAHWKQWCRRWDLRPWLPCGWSVVTESSSWHCARPVHGVCQVWGMLSLNSHKMHCSFTLPPSTPSCLSDST